MNLIKVLFTIFTLLPLWLSGQTGAISGLVTHNGSPVPLVSIELAGTGMGTITDTAGFFSFRNLSAGVYRLRAGAAGMQQLFQKIILKSGERAELQLRLESSMAKGEEAVVTGTLRPVHRLESPVPVEVISSKLFKKNASVCLFDAMTLVNGVQPQINCNVCNTGDIHINGMEGPYTLVLIDGMPIVSSLATVYGLNGIPNSMVDRVELVKGPAASLYGSEAMGGIINVITKSPQKAPAFAADIMASSWQELNTDVAVKWRAGSAAAMLGVNYFNYQKPHDKNGDGFTDITQQNRISIFNKWNWQRPQNRAASLAGRYVYEDRWGGQLNWTKQWRGTDSIYGEYIDTRRWELTGLYQLPVKPQIMAQLSLNGHYQDSYYGTVPYKASQHILFAQAYWSQAYGRHQLLSGASFRYTQYDDNSPATAAPDGLKNQPAVTPLPGFFVQDEWNINARHTLLTGYRFDYDRNHGAIHSPRLAWKWRPAPNHTLRASFGTGFRVVNLFTEDHAALTGARKVVIAEALLPEKSINSNLNYVFKTHWGGTLINVDATAFYTRFSNKRHFCKY
jgi:outer membrane receptor for ferrienterochelin and colicins